MGYRLVDHTGDIGVDVEAATLEALFEEAAAAFIDLVCDPATLEPGPAETLAVSAPAPDLLLLAWLSELLYQLDARDRLAATTRVRIAGDDEHGYRLEAAVAFDTFDPSRHAIKLLVKAVTYHALAVEHGDRGWRARVVFDV